METIRIKVKDLQPYQKRAKSWKKSNLTFPETQKIIKLFKANKNFKILIDKKNPRFLKGQLVNGIPQGVRINLLPDGKVLDKAYSLFAKNLKIHDQNSGDHWDVIYQNKGGTYAYCYTLEKKEKNRNKKYNKVKKFDQIYNKLSRNISLALKDNTDHLAVPMHTLLKTYMRIGNEIYYNAHGHKGLTTLKKKDITIKGDKVTFNYLAKDGVPRLIKHKFSNLYVNRLKKQMKSLKKEDFVFKSCKSNHPLAEREFKKAFLKYCGQEFYPHIVRSHHATSKVRRFLKGRRKISKEEVKKLYLSIASDLGHKKFVKKEQKWEDNYSVTINHYIQPQLVEKVNSLVK